MYWTQLSDMVLRKRNFMLKVLTQLGLKPIPPEGGYFMVADCSQLIDKLDLTQFYDSKGQTFAFVKWLSKNGLQALSLSVFYCQKYKHLSKSLIRFCFIKSDETLAEAERVLKNLKQRLDEQDFD